MLWAPVESSCMRAAQVEARPRLPGSAEGPPSTVPMLKAEEGQAKCRVGPQVGAQ